jgi:hypothetical protein
MRIDNGAAQLDKCCQDELFRKPETYKFRKLFVMLRNVSESSLSFIVTNLRVP